MSSRKMVETTSRQRLIFVMVSVLNVCNAFCFALQAPFYPKVAESKGMNPTEYGLVFGIFQLVVFVVSPLFGHFITDIGSKFMLITGVMCTGCTCILFGVLIFVEGTTNFICLSFLVRIVEAISCAAYNTASFSIVAQEFPDRVGSTMAVLETCFGVGLIIGPTFGGMLYTIGGYITPFAVLGSLLILCAITVAIFLPDTDLTYNIHNKSNIFKVLGIPEVLLAMLGTLLGANNIGYLQASLEPHIRNITNLSPTQLGLMFIVNGAAYAIFAPLWGKLCDRGINARFLIVSACLIIIVAFLFIGPAPFIPIKPTLWLVALCLTLNGIGTGGQLVPSFAGAHKDAIKAGFPRDMTTLGLISGLWTSFFALGAFIGPTLGGFIMDHSNFEYSTLYVVILHAFVGLLHVLFFIYRKFRPREISLPRERL